MAHTKMPSKTGSSNLPKSRQVSSFPFNELDSSSEVWPYQKWPSKTIVPYRVKRVVSPFEIYLEYVVESTAPSYHNWFSEMQEFYNDEDLNSEWQLKTGAAYKGRCYACKDFKDDKWYRVRCHKTEENTAKVFYCDIGKTQLVDLSALRELKPEFAYWSSQAFRAHLAHVMPMDGGMTWTKQACTLFEKMVKDKIFQGIVSYRQDKVVHERFPDVIVNLGIVLYEDSNDFHTSDTLCTINARLVDMGLAQAIGVHASCHHTIRPLDYEIIMENDQWDQPEDSSSDSSSTTDSDDDKTSVKEENLDTPSFNLSSIANTLKANLPSRVWDSEFNTHASSDNEDERIFEPLPDEVRDRMCHVSLSYVLAPNQIFVQFVYRQNALRKLQEDLKKHVQDDGPLTPEELTPGRFVACFLRDFWCRAVIKNNFPHTKRVKLLIVDHGNESTVEQSCVKNLPDEFLGTPSFAFRVHLDGQGIKPTGQAGWSVEAGQEFRKYAYAWDRTSAVYYLFRPQHAKKIMLFEYTQEIFYDFDEEKWFAGPRKHIDANMPINSLRSHQLLRPFYCSLGADIQYEISVDSESPFWSFCPIYDDLVEKELALVEGYLYENIDSKIVDFVAETAEKAEQKPKPAMIPFAALTNINSLRISIPLSKINRRNF